MDNWEEVIIKIKLRIKEIGITQIQLSKRMGIHQSQLNRMINSKTPPTMTNLIKLIKALGLTLKIETI